MTRNRFCRLMPAAAGLLIASNLLAQNEPVRNWAAPLYWQPSEKESAVLPRAVDRQAEAPAAALISTSTGPLVFVAITPCRMLDTRGYDPTFGNGTEWGAPALPAGGTRTVRVAGLTAGYCSLPAAAQAVSLNVTLWPTPGTQVRWLTLWPAGQTMPAASTINDYQGTVYSPAHGVTMYGLNNAAIVPLGPSGNYGAFNIYVTDATHLFIDVNGYYAAPGVLPLAAGTAAAPALTFGVDSASGLYSSGAGVVKVSTSGNDRLTVNSSGISVNGDVDMTGNLTQNGSNLVQTGPFGNVALGLGAMVATSGQQITAVGHQALKSLTSGTFNTAVGYMALRDDTTGSHHTAVGDGALEHIVSASDDTAVGFLALSSVAGSNNTAVGSSALRYTTGADNTAFGQSAGEHITSGSFNTVMGAGAGDSTITADGNTAVGWQAGHALTSGSHNAAFGFLAAHDLTSGNNNIALGYQAGRTLLSGSNNIDIGHIGASTDTGVIRIGTAGNQTATYIAGIRDAGGSGAIVYVDANGKLFSLPSARRFKQDIQDLGDTTDMVMGLRPVRFRFKAQGPDGPEQFGLIAEEVEEVAPELVGHDKDGRIDSVAYDKVNAMLLNEVQKQHRLIRRLEARLAELEGRAQ